MLQVTTMKMLKISKCMECPYFSKVHYDNYFCWKHEKIFYDKNIPKWCKLKDYKEV